MTPGETETIDYGLFAERLRTGARWQLLREFQDEWGYEPPAGGPVWPRWSEDEHQAYLRRLKAAATGEEEDRFAGVDLTLPIPRALDEWWDLPFNSFTHRPRLYWTNPVWPPTVRPGPAAGDADGPSGDDPFAGLTDDRRICVFKAEYQYCNEWGYPAAESALADPRVLVSTEDGWALQSRSISEFFLQLAVQRIPAHFGWTVRLNQAAPEVLERVRRTFPELGLLSWRELGCETITYGAPDAIIYHDLGDFADFTFIVHARTRAALEGVADLLDTDWTGRIEEPAAVEDVPASFRTLSLRAGDSDPLGRWTVRTVSDLPSSPADPAPVPLAELTGGHDPTGRTVWAVGTGLGLAAAGDQAGGLYLWRLDRRPDRRLDRPGQTPETQARPAAHDAPVTAIACADLEGCGPTVVSGDVTGLVQLWSPEIDWGPVPIAHRRSAETLAIAVAELAAGPVVTAAWTDGTVRVWDVLSGTDADLPLGPGIETLALSPDGTLTVGGRTGTAAVELHPDRIWPQRELTVLLNRVEWESLRAADGTGEKVRGWILDAASADAGTAEVALARLREALYDEGTVFPATVQAVPFLLRLTAEPGNRVRHELLSLTLDIARAALDFTGHEPDPELGVSWADLAHEVTRKCEPVLSTLLDDADPAVRETAGRLLSDLFDS